MIALRDFLEDFSAPVRRQMMADDAQGIDIEGAKLEAFENGYRDGWDDATKTQSEEQAKLTANLGQHLQDLSFTYQEAYGHAVGAMAPVLQDIVDKILPDLAREMIGAHVVEMLQKAVTEQATTPVEIAVSSASAPAVAPLLEADFGFPVRLVEDDTLADEQADIRFGSSEQQIDLDALLTSVKEAVAGFAHDNGRALAHG